MIYAEHRRNEVALACVLLAKFLFEQVQSPSDVDEEVQWTLVCASAKGRNSL